MDDEIDVLLEVAVKDIEAGRWRQVDHFARLMAQAAILIRKQSAGCACKFDDDGALVSLCMAHRFAKEFQTSVFETEIERLTAEVAKLNVKIKGFQYRYGIPQFDIDAEVSIPQPIESPHTPSGWLLCPRTHRAADEFWRVWKEVGETHRHGYYESTWMAVDAAMAAVEESAPVSGSHGTDCDCSACCPN